MSDDSEVIFGSKVGPVTPAVYRLCVQCGEGFLKVEPTALCGEECRDAYGVREGLGGEPKVERLQVDKYLEIGQFVERGDDALVLTGIITRGPGATVGDFVRVANLPAESPLVQ